MGCMKMRFVKLIGNIVSDMQSLSWQIERSTIKRREWERDEKVFTQAHTYSLLTNMGFWSSIVLFFQLKLIMVANFSFHFDQFDALQSIFFQLKKPLKQNLEHNRVAKFTTERVVRILIYVYMCGVSSQCLNKFNSDWWFAIDNHCSIKSVLHPSYQRRRTLTGSHLILNKGDLIRKVTHHCCPNPHTLQTVYYKLDICFRSQEVKLSWLDVNCCDLWTWVFKHIHQTTITEALRH